MMEINRIVRDWFGSTNPRMLKLPLIRSEPTLWVVHGLFDGDTDVTDQLKDKFFAVMALTPGHIYQILVDDMEQFEQYCSYGYRAGAIQDVIRTEFDRFDYGSENPMPWPLPNVFVDHREM